MLTSFEVGAVLKVWDEASPAMIKLATRAKELDGLFVKLNEKIKLFNTSTSLRSVRRIVGCYETDDRKFCQGRWSSLDTATKSARGSDDTIGQGGRGCPRDLRQEYRGVLAEEAVRLPASGTVATEGLAGAEGTTVRAFACRTRAVCMPAAWGCRARR